MSVAGSDPSAAEAVPQGSPAGRARLAAAAQALVWGVRQAWQLPRWLWRVAAPRLRREASEAARASLRGLLVVVLLGALLAFVNFWLCNRLLEGWVVDACKAPRLVSESRAHRPLGQPGLEIWVNHNTSLSPLEMSGWLAGQQAAFDDELVEYGAGFATRSYRVFTELPSGRQQEVMHIEARPSRGLDGEIRLVLDLALVVAQPRAGGRPEYARIAWWQTGGLASSNALVRVRPSLLGGLRELSFPTGHSSLVTWIKENWEASAKALRPELYGSGKPCHIKAKLIREALAPELARLLGEELGGLQTGGPLVLVRIFNGLIQLLTFSAFFTALLLIAARYGLFVRAERREATSEQLSALFGEVRDAGWDAERTLEQVLKLAFDFQQRWGVTPSVLQFCIGWLTGRRMAQDDGQSLPFAESYGELLRERRESQAYSIRYLVGAIPALGFIGTVLGIGAALMGTGSVLSDQLAKQQSGVSSVALALGLAFDTTFVSLVLSLLVHFGSSWLSAREEDVLQDAKETMFSLLSRNNPAEAPPAIGAPRAASPPARPRPRPRLKLVERLHSDRLKPQRPAPAAPPEVPASGPEPTAPEAEPVRAAPAPRRVRPRQPAPQQLSSDVQPLPGISPAEAAAQLEQWQAELEQRFARLARGRPLWLAAALVLKSSLLVAALWLLVRML